MNGILVHVAAVSLVFKMFWSFKLMLFFFCKESNPHTNSEATSISQTLFLLPAEICVPFSILQMHSVL